ncbi:MAG: hypothetical protein GOMPHAMPRED_001463 [Gomphillus americanus]|uniref:Nop14-like protein n=1 Tax=Gomphillus americanus TaxID=1940652 RepID=A0A8H3I7Y0_9LECA|nr:MAG: hypothetical protein GOMPHAMPRED_001463 [Gomphillus americanus]
MVGSQLKQLKASLRDRGRLGPTPSKKQRKSQQEARRQSKQSELLEAQPVKNAKFDFLNGQARNGSNKDSAARERREQARRDGILYEMQRKQKVGGINDRRFGEDDPTMTPEERAMERFIREKQRSGRKSGVFDLEEEDEDEDGLTHLGRPLTLKDDFQDSMSNDSASDGGVQRGVKRRRLLNGEVEFNADHQDTAQPERPKTKKEVMEEVIAKSKLHKYERQKAKEDDDELRAELDADVADIFALMNGRKATSNAMAPVAATMNPDRAALINGNDREQADREYDMRLRAMVQDKRSMPTTRTKTEEEVAQEEAARLERLEAQRLRRMQGEEFSDEGDDVVADGDEDFYGGVEESIAQPRSTNSTGFKPRLLLRQQDVEDEDEFDLDEDLVAIGSDESSLQSGESSSLEDAVSEDEDEDEEFVMGIATEDDDGKLLLGSSMTKPRSLEDNLRLDLAFTYACPQSLEELLAITKEVAYADLATVIQRIRALYHSGLAEGNKAKLAGFAAALVEYISYLPRQKDRPDLAVLETLIRHIHSLAKSYPNSVSDAFREQLRVIQKTRFSAPDAGDLIMLTAIGSIYPTSDHFHQVVTPAMLTIARYLEHGFPTTISSLATGTYLSTLALDYQRLSKRYIPELVNYALYAIDILSPEPSTRLTSVYPDHTSIADLRIKGDLKDSHFHESLSFWVIDNLTIDDKNLEFVKISILAAHLELINTIVEQWISLSAYPEIMSVVLESLDHLSSKNSLAKLPNNIRQLILSLKGNVESSVAKALQTRRPLTLHNHRPLSIKMSVPKFEDSYNPNKRYDPDTERAESSKLRAEHKKERKAVIREFRKEARAEAVVQLEEKKARDEAYEKKYKRLVAEIQGEEGREANAYEREKAARKNRR